MPHHNHQPSSEHLPLGTHIIDGLEGDIARIELQNGHTQDVPRRLLPPGAQEGDVLVVTAAGVTVDHAETQQRKQQAQAQLDALNAQAPTGEIDL